ncbi:MAG: hypothetical protein HXX11_05000 [Desulfuromonadales bacterium]|nr:hypothetical protein [Desulfuromonadales bacterium]
MAADNTVPIANFRETGFGFKGEKPLITQRRNDATTQRKAEMRMKVFFKLFWKSGTYHNTQHSRCGPRGAVISGIEGCLSGSDTKELSL